MISDVKAGRIIAVIEESCVVGAHDPSRPARKGQIPILEHEIPHYGVFWQLSDYVIEAITELPYDGAFLDKIFAEEPKSCSRYFAFSQSCFNVQHKLFPF